MRSLLLLTLAAACCVLFAILPFVHGDCGLGSIDLSSLAETDFTQEAHGMTWLVRPCGITTNPECLISGPTSSVCQDADAWGYWPDALYHNWTFMDPSDGVEGVQVSLQGTYCPRGCNEAGVFQALVQFPCAEEQGTLSVTQGDDCTANFSIPTPLACGPETRLKKKGLILLD